MADSLPTLDDLMDYLPPPDIDEPPPPIDLPPDYEGAGDFFAESLPTPGGDLPPAYPVNLPSSFPIGAKDTPPLVKLSEIEAHLRLLGAFWQLRQDVVHSTGSDPSWDRLSEAERWTVFVSRSARRFELWYTNVICRLGREDKALSRNEIPPLDVAMIWHAFFLNPHEYVEDGITRAKRLYKLGHFPLLRIASAINPNTMRPLDPPHDRTFHFEAYSGQPFLFSVMVPRSETINFPCPRCGKEMQVPWYDEARTGFGQSLFQATCPSCQLEFGKQAIGIRRLAEHIRTWLVMTQPPGEWISGTLLDYAVGMPDFKKAYFFNRKLTQYFETVCKKDEQKTAVAIGDQVKWSVPQAEYCIRIGLRIIDNSASPPRWGRILSYYNHAGIFSLDLVGATLRQGAFIEEMVKLGWTRPGTFATDKSVLARSIARYHAWLDLIASDPSLAPVPTLDIDLVWHTNMLFMARYRWDTFKLVGRIPNHDDKVEETALADAFDETARAWRARFGVPYALCGCAPPTTDSTLKKLKSIGRRNSHSSRLSAVEIQALIEDEGSGSEDDATHPSEHYAILVLDNEGVEQSRAKRTNELRKAQEAARKGVAKGKGLAASSNVLGRQEKIEPKADHMQAFRKTRPGPQEDRRAVYDAFLVNGKALGAGQCAVGIAGGLCQVGGPQSFCTTGGRCQAAGNYGMAFRGGLGVKLF